MGIVFRQSIKTTLVIFAGALLGALVNIGYFHVLTRQIQGLTRTILLEGALLQNVISFGTSGVILTYLLRYPPGHKRKILITVSGIIPLVVTCILIIPYIVFRESLINLYKPGERGLINEYYFWIPVLVLLWGYMSQFEYYFWTQQKTAVSTFMREVVLKLLNIGLIGLIGFELISVHVFILATILIYIIPSLIMLPMALRTEGFGFSREWSVFSRKEYKELFSFSWYHLLVGLSVTALDAVSAYMLPILSSDGLSSVAIYGFAVFIVAIMVAPYRAMTSSSIATLTVAYNSGDKQHLHQLFQRSSINIFLVSIAMAVLIGCNLHNALPLIEKGNERLGMIIPVSLILILGKLVDTISGLNTELIYMSPYYKFNFRLSIVLLVLLIGFNLLLIPRFGIIGAAWGTTLATILFNIGKMIFLWLKMDLQPFSKNTLLILSGGIAAAFAGYFLPHLPNVFFDATVRSIIIIAVYAGMMLWLKPSEDLRTFLQSFKEKKRLF